ncbi:dimethyladenosine transferase [Fodinibius salinus]|uniref:Ribosomal RNA small subunit methyltransferase A n=1 Tax=Fodinibius salinus TaxID=860790 RepID=A0A5D3YII9_9BACT|nr:16S rRNA (adenine(1518)-N(6)/adenine(1519)-N(6))-dimethyltransferase RsmA [Fodinibius salinus]TYP92555.1 dimethyladenosine transferase [Fodinibius salinus]
MRPKKSLGQHFLTDENMIQKIADAVQAGEGDRVIEIGPGTGALTAALIDRYEEVIGIEIDERAVEVLEHKFPNLKVHQANILDVDWEQFTMGKQKTHVVGNLPYYITSQILFSLLANRALFSDALLMMQKEVAERIVADIRTKAYGILSVQTRLMATPEILFPVSPHCFRPQPNVESAMLKLNFNKGRLSCTDDQLKKVVRTAFNQRRKKLSNALKPIVSKDQQPDGFDFDKRAEAWLPSEYEKLTARLVEDGILT